MGMFDFLKKKKKPNVIFLMIDGAGRPETLTDIPYFRELGKKGTLARQLICYAPYSIGSLNALFSGIIGNTNGVYGYYKSYNFDKKNIFTLTQYLKEAGYRTELDFVIEDVVPAQGFDKIRLFGKDDDKEIDLIARHGEILTQLAGKEPFFVFLDYNKIALELSKNVIKKYDDFSEEYFSQPEKNLKKYLSWVQDSTRYIEAMLNKLKELHIYDDSLIVIFSDHGESIGSKKGERVHGVFTYDYTINCWAYLIGKPFPQGHVINNQCRHIDILPTILDAVGIQEKSGFKPIEGTSLLPWLTEEKEVIAYSETGGLGGPNPSPDIHNVQSVRTNEWKLIYNTTTKEKELYNTVEDPLEERNVIDDEPKVANELWDQYQCIHQRIQKINEQFPNETEQQPKKST